MRPKPRHLWVVLLIVLSALVAFAQPKKGAGPTKDADKKAADKDDKAKDDKAKDDKPDGAGVPPGAAAADLGDPPPKQADGPADKTKPSPLTPRANEFPDGGAAPAPAEYDRLLGDIAALRARVASLTTTMFKSTLDDGVVYVAGDRFSANDEKPVYEHAVAPGHHILGVEIERVDSRGREYKTWQNTKMSIVVPESKVVEARVELEDDSDMAVDFPDDQDGEYELNVKLRAQVAD